MLVSMLRPYIAQMMVGLRDLWRAHPRSYRTWPDLQFSPRPSLSPIAIGRQWSRNAITLPITHARCTARSDSRGRCP